MPSSSRKNIEKPNLQNPKEDERYFLLRSPVNKGVVLTCNPIFPLSFESLQETGPSGTPASPIPGEPTAAISEGNAAQPLTSCPPRNELLVKQAPKDGEITHRVANVPFGEDSVLERSRVRLSFVHGHHVYIATVIANHPSVHRGSADAGQLRGQGETCR